MNSHTLQQATSFRNKIILIFFVIIILPFLFFAYYAHIKSVESISNANTLFSMNYMIRSKENFDQFLGRFNDQINDIIKNPKLQSLLEEAPKTPEEEDTFTSNMLTFIYQNKPAVDAFRIRVIPIDPSYYPSYLGTIDESHIGNQFWFREAQHTVAPMWQLFLPEEGKYSKPLISKIKRFTGLYDQAPRGIIIADLSEDQLKRYFSPAQRMEGQRTYLLHQDGMVLYDSLNSNQIGKQISSHELLGLLQSEKEGAETLSLDGETKLVTFVKLDSEPWFMVNTTPLNDLTHPIQEMNKLLAIYLGIYLLCCIGVIIYITLYFTNPLMWLVRSMRKLESGDFQYVLPNSSRRDEIGWLYRGFNNMLRKIEMLIEEASRSERIKKELEFQVLSHQINPHFLYNTLESIRWKAEQHHMTDISEMVSSLGNLLRLSLNKGKEITTVVREIEQVRAYVNIEQARMGQPLRILFSADDEILHLPILRLLLQPLVENAIHHGIRGNLNKGKIILFAKRKGQDIYIELSDNGEGIPKHILDQLNSPEEPNRLTQQHGVGLRNVNDRLKLYFGDSYQLQIKSEPGKGTKIILKHPIIPTGTEHDEEDINKE